MNVDAKFLDPPSEQLFDLALCDRQPIRMARREVADVQSDPSERNRRKGLPPLKKPVGNAALIEELDGACVHASRARSDQGFCGSTLQEGNVDACERQLA